VNRAQKAAREPAGRAAFGWYGSKARLAPEVAALASGIPHRVYVEAYAGSAAVLFAKPRAQVEIINDLDGQVVNFFRVLRDRPAELARACQLTPYSRDEYAADAAGHDVLSELEQARRFWARCCQSFNSAGAGRRAGWAISSAPGSNEARSSAGLAAQLEAIAGRSPGNCALPPRRYWSPGTTTTSTVSSTPGGTGSTSGSPSPAGITAQRPRGTPLRSSGAIVLPLAKTPCSR
jgi:hypothetical protein